MRLLNLLLVLPMCFTLTSCGFGLLTSESEKSDYDYDDYYDDDWVEKENKRLEREREQRFISGKVKCENKRTCLSYSGLLHRRTVNGVGACTVVLIAPNMIATNAHCLRPDRWGNHPSMRNHTVYFPETSELPGETANFKRIIGLSQDFRSQSHSWLLPDIAIAELDRSLKRDFIEPNRTSGIEPGELYTIHKVDPPVGSNRPAIVKTIECEATSKTFLMPQYSKSDDPVAFVKDCHVVGGNSGSPVLNRNGELVGLVHAGKNFNFNPRTTRVRLPGLSELVGSLLRGEQLNFTEKISQYEVAYNNAIEVVPPFGEVSNFGCVTLNGQIISEARCLRMADAAEPFDFSDFVTSPGLFEPIWDWGRDNSSQFIWTLSELEPGRYSVKPACVIRARETGKNYPKMGEVREYYDSVEWNFNFYVDDNVQLVPYLSSRLSPTSLTARFGALDLKHFGFNGLDIELSYYRNGEDLEDPGYIHEEADISLCERGVDHNVYYDALEEAIEVFMAERRATAP